MVKDIMAFLAAQDPEVGAAVQAEYDRQRGGAEADGSSPAVGDTTSGNETGKPSWWEENVFEPARDILAAANNVNLFRASVLTQDEWLRRNRYMDESDYSEYLDGRLTDWFNRGDLTEQQVEMLLDYYLDSRSMS